MNNVRQIALNCTVKKIAYRQSKDGIVISFLVHHAELPDALAIADLGTPYMMALVEIDDNDQPAAQRKEPAPKSEPLTAPVAAAVDSGPIRAVKRAGYLCKDKRFQAFLKQEFAGGWRLMKEPNDDERAAEFVRWRCGVGSRRFIPGSPEAYARWQELDSGYQAWLLKP